MSDTTPDTTALRALADTYTEAPGIVLPQSTVRALCDGYDEAQRLRESEAVAQTWAAKHNAARMEALNEAQRLRAAWATERDGAEGLAADLHAAREEAAAASAHYERAQADANAARQALADLIGELRGLPSEARPGQWIVDADELRAVIDRHEPEAT